MGEPDTSFPRLVTLAAHDLRTPLATIHGFAQTLVRMGDLGEPKQRYMEMIDSAALQRARWGGGPASRRSPRPGSSSDRSEP